MQEPASDPARVLRDHNRVGSSFEVSEGQDADWLVEVRGFAAVAAPRLGRNDYLYRVFRRLDIADVLDTGEPRVSIPAHEFDDALSRLTSDDIRALFVPWIRPALSVE